MKPVDVVPRAAGQMDCEENDIGFASLWCGLPASPGSYSTLGGLQHILSYITTLLCHKWEEEPAIPLASLPQENILA